MISSREITKAAWEVWETSNGNNAGYVRSNVNSHTDFIVTASMDYAVSDQKVRREDVINGVAVYAVGEPILKFEVQTRTIEDAYSLMEDVRRDVVRQFVPPFGVALEDVFYGVSKDKYAVMPAQIYVKLYFVPLVTVDYETQQIITAGGLTRKDVDAVFNMLAKRYP